MNKYIIDVGDAYVRHALGRKLIIPVIINNDTEYWVNTNIQLTPYTEPDLEQVREEAFKNGYDAACNDIDIKSKTSAAYQKGYQDATVKISSNEQAIAEKAYQSGLNDAWEAARKICLNESDGGLSAITVHDIFNTEHYRDALRDYTPAKAIEKIRQYEQEKEEQIQVGDEVITASGKAVVLGVGPVHFEYVNADGSNGFDKVKNAEKTGRHFPEIAEVLAKMKEEQS